MVDCLFVCCFVLTFDFDRRFEGLLFSSLICFLESDSETGVIEF